MPWITAAPWRVLPATAHFVNENIYFANAAQIGDKLLKLIIRRAEQQDYHVLIGAIESTNQASIRLHEKNGFTCCGIIKQAGFKFGTWLDLSFYQLIVASPAMPVDG